MKLYTVYQPCITSELCYYIWIKIKQKKHMQGRVWLLYISVDCGIILAAGSDKGCKVYESIAG